MEGNVTKRKDGRWMGRVDLPLLADGKRRQKSVYAATRPECKRLVNELIEKIEKGNFDEVDKLSVEAYFLKWADVYCKNLSPTTTKIYKLIINKHVISQFGDKLLIKLLPMQIQEFYNELEEDEYSNKTIQNIHRLLHKAFSDAVKNNILEKNPADYVDIPKVIPYVFNVYDEEKFNLLLNKVKNTIEEIPILLAGMCGLRRGEVMGLKWEDIDFKQGVISIKRNAVVVDGEIIVKQPKTRGSVRKFSVSPVVLGILKKYRGFGWVYPNKEGGPENGDNYYHRFKKLLIKHNLEHIRFHDLRHFNATMMLKYGVSDREAAERLGHSDANMTKRYQHVLKDMDQNSANKINSIVKINN